WSPSGPGTASQSVLTAVINLDANKVFKTCISFPTRRTASGAFNKNAKINNQDLYDPLFLILLASQLLIEHKRMSTTEWVQVFRSNIFSLVVRGLTSRHEDFRKVAVNTLGGLLSHDGDFLERDQVIYVLNILGDLLPPPTFTPQGPRVPAYTAVLLSHALRSIFYPSSFLYPLISRFLLQRPEFDVTDVPMLYSMLYSSEDGEWTKERTWMIHFLTDAMDDGSAHDWSILKRRHTWDLLASMWQSSRPEERSLRKGILEVSYLIDVLYTSYINVLAMF
ncbi:hypothetical protein M422DRAFT_188053, partial [Sphaerobolus stellatus SS14]